MMRRELDTRITSFGEKVSLIWYSDSGRVELEVEDREGGFVRAVPVAAFAASDAFSHPHLYLDAAYQPA